MVISVFPNYGSGFQAFERARGNRLQAEAARTEMDLRNRREQAYNRMLEGLPKDQALALSALPSEAGAAAVFNASRADQQAQAERTASAREAQLSFLQGEGQRFAAARAAEGDNFDEQGFLRGSVIRASDAGVPLNDPASLQERVRTWGQGYTVAPDSESSTEFERLLESLDSQEAARLRAGRAEYLAGFRARPSSGGGTADIIRAAMGGMYPMLRAQDIASYDLERLRGADERASTASSVLSTIDRLNERMGEAGGSTQGALGFARRIGAGLLGQLDQLSEFGEGGQMLAGQIRGVTRDASARIDPEGQSGLTPETFNEFFNPELGGVEYLTSTLAYMIAKMRDPGGRVTDRDYNAAVSSIGGGPFGSDAMLDSALREVVFEAQQALAGAEEVRRQVRTGEPFVTQQRPAPAIDPNAPIEDLINALSPD